MSTVKLQGNASGSGSVTLTSPNVSTDITVTLPNISTTLGSVSTTVGDVGTYALLKHTGNPANFTAGSTRAGSGLYYANCFQSSGSNWGGGQVSPSGTWQIMGHGGRYNGTVNYTGNSTSISVYIRIS